MTIVDRDVLSEILLRVDPSLIFDCIQVSKEGLELITDPEFRQLYQEKWKTHSKLVGLTKNCHGSTNLVATSELGRIIDESESMHSFFVSKSGQGDGLILFGMLPDILFVSKPGEENPVRLPDPGESAATATFSDQKNPYKVLRIARNDNWNVCTFSSSTGEWESSSYPINRKVPCHLDSDKAGIMSSGGRNVVYWPQLGHGSSWICAYYDNGYLLNATSGKGFGHKINIWRLDDDDNNVGWEFLHTVLPHPIPRRFAFVSFFPASSPGSIVVESSHRLFLYCPDQSRELDTSAPLSKQLWVHNHTYHGTLDLAPLTMADLGVWPSSPFSGAAKTNIHGVKQMVAMTLSVHRDRVRKNMAEMASFRLSDKPVRRNRRMVR